MTDFQPGDQVYATREIAQTVPLGTAGRVVRIGDVPMSPFDFQVEFPGYPFFGISGEPQWPVLAKEISKTLQEDQ